MSKVEETSYKPSKPTLSIYACEPISITRKHKQLTIQCVETTTIPPRPVYHPAIIRASLSMFGKKPYDLDSDEIAKFNQYRAWKCQNGEQIETDIIYNPGSGNQPCLHCGLPT